jgi:flagellar biosynthesis protein
MDQQKKAAALKYRQGIDHAPQLVAKGRGLIAEKILALARERGIPIREDRNMVEILSTLSLYEEIPPDLYKAVAELLAFIYKLGNKA